jgi:uncharacterized delta-60 repeat protein
VRANAKGDLVMGRVVFIHTLRPPPRKGFRRSSPGYQVFALAGYTAAAILDASYGKGGEVTTTFNSSGNDVASALALQSDGKLVTVGSAQIKYVQYSALVRYTASGALDTSFGTKGTVTTKIGSALYDDAVALQGDGKIVAAGYSAINSQTGTQTEFALERYTSGGVLDATFGSGGEVTTDFGSVGSTANAVVLQGEATNWVMPLATPPGTTTTNPEFGSLTPQGPLDLMLTPRKRAWHPSLT